MNKRVVFIICRLRLISLPVIISWGLLIKVSMPKATSTTECIRLLIVAISIMFIIGSLLAVLR